MKLLWQQPVLLQEHHFQTTTMKDSGGEDPMKMHVMINYVCITKHARYCNILTLLCRTDKKRPTSRSTSPLRPYALAPKSASGPRHHHHASLPRSRWQQLMVHAGSAAGTTAAVISEESMKCLRYCLSWLQVRTQQQDF